MLGHLGSEHALRRCPPGRARPRILWGRRRNISGAAAVGGRGGGVLGAEAADLEALGVWALRQRVFLLEEELVEIVVVAVVLVVIVLPLKENLLVEVVL